MPPPIRRAAPIPIASSCAPTGRTSAPGSNRLAVAPGMVVDVDLLVGERTILSYLTDRILRLREDAFREG